MSERAAGQPSPQALVRRWLELAAQRVALHAEELTRLDAAIGDGDHGINLHRGFTAVGARLAALETNDEGAPTATELLALAGRTLVSTVGGASGPLYGTFFLELAAEVDRGEDGHPAGFDAGRLGLALAGSAAAVGRRGRSTTGEKTMLDALVPGAGAWRDAAGENASLRDCASAAARAADAGRRSTEAMVATKGRASYLGERSRGHLDPGATSAALLLAALADAIDQVEGDGASR